MRLPRPATEQNRAINFILNLDSIEEITHSILDIDVLYNLRALWHRLRSFKNFPLINSGHCVGLDESTITILFSGGFELPTPKNDGPSRNHTPRGTQNKIKQYTTF